MNYAEKDYAQTDYAGAQASTLCRGCGHDLISRALMKAFYEAQANLYKTVKISGIGCSSKTPAYFFKLSQGFNTVHGRMASVATGVKIANRGLTVLGISGDGDTGSIGLGSFLHTVRRNVPMIYIVENNGVYGLTKGQLSATAQKGSRRFSHLPAPGLDLCRLCLEAGGGFVARGFSGNERQLTGLLKAALKYKGFAFIDIISPCVVYGNEKEFPHSYSFMKERALPLNEPDLIEEREAVRAALKEGETRAVRLPDGSVLHLKSLSSEEHDPSDGRAAAALLRKTPAAKNKVVPTGLIYYKEKMTFLEREGLPGKPLTRAEEQDMRPSAEALKDAVRLFS